MAKSDGRTVIVGDVGSLEARIKQPGDNFIYVFDFSSWLDTGVTVISVGTIIVPSSSGGSSPTAGTPAIDSTGTLVSFLVSGGGAGYLGNISFPATLSNGEAKETGMNLTIALVN